MSPSPQQHRRTMRAPNHFIRATLNHITPISACTYVLNIYFILRPQLRFSILICIIPFVRSLSTENKKNLILSFPILSGSKLRKELVCGFHFKTFSSKNQSFLEEEGHIRIFKNHLFSRFWTKE